MATAIRRRCSNSGLSTPFQVEKREVGQSQQAGAGMADRCSGDREVVVVVDRCGDRLWTLKHAKDFGIAFPESNECFHRT